MNNSKAKHPLMWVLFLSFKFILKASKLYPYNKIKNKTHLRSLDLKEK